MLTTLSTIKARLALLDTDTQYDALLTNTIKALSVRFDKECNRTLARTENFAQEFDAGLGEICAACYPIESVARFELKSAESSGWLPAIAPEFLVRGGCIISLEESLGATGQLGRVIYTGGYVMRGAAPGAGQRPLPDDLEQAAVEQVVCWFQNRDRVGIIREWPKGGTYLQLADLDLLPNVRAVLRPYLRYVCGAVA